MKAARSNLLPPKEQLEEKHASIDRRIAELVRRKGITDAEALELKELKKQKLATKDRLSASDR